MYCYKRTHNGGSGPHLFSCIHRDRLADSENEGDRMAKYVRGPAGSAINAEHIVRLFVIQGGVRACAGFRTPNDFDHYLVAETINGDICDLAAFNDRMTAEDAIEELIAAIANPNSNSLLGLFPINANLTDVSRHDIRLEHEIAGRNDANKAAVDNAASRIAGAIVSVQVPVSY